MGHVEVLEARKVKVRHSTEGSVGNAKIHEGVLQSIEGVTLEVLCGGENEEVEDYNRKIRKIRRNKTSK